MPSSIQVSGSGIVGDQEVLVLAVLEDVDLRVGAVAAEVRQKAVDDVERALAGRVLGRALERSAGEAERRIVLVDDLPDPGLQAAEVNLSTTKPCAAVKRRLRSAVFAAPK